MNRLDNTKNHNCWCCCTEERKLWDKLRHKYFPTKVHLDNLMAARISLEKELQDIPQAKIDFSYVLRKIKPLIPAQFFYDVFTAYYLKVDYKHYLKSVLSTQIIDKIKKICFKLLLKKEFRQTEKLIKNLDKLADRETGSFKYHLQDAIEELRILLETRKDTNVAPQKNDRLKDAHIKIENLTKTILESISKDQYTSETMSTGTAHVTAVSNKDGKKVVFKAYPNALPCVETETIQDMASIYFNETKAFPPSIRLSSEIPLALEYKQEELALIKQGYNLADKKSNSEFISFLKEKLGISKSIYGLHGFIVPVTPIPEEIFLSKWDFTHSDGKIVTDCSFQHIQQLFILNQIEMKNINLPQDQTLEELDSSLNVGWKYLSRRAILVQRFVKMMPLSDFNMGSRMLIGSHLSEGNLSKCVKIGEWCGLDIHAPNTGIEIVKSEEYKQLSNATYSYIRIINKIRSFAENVSLDAFHEDYLKGHVNQDSFIDVNSKGQSSVKLPPLFKTLKNLKYRFVFFDQEQFFPNSNLIKEYTYQNKTCYQLPIRIEIEGIEQPLSQEDLRMLINSLDNDIKAYNFLYQKYGWNKKWKEKIEAFIERIFSRTEFLALCNMLKKDEKDPKALMARIERFILSPRSPFSTRERLQYLAKWHKLKNNHDPLEKMMLFRNHLLNVTAPSCLMLLKAMYPLLADVRELIETLQPDFVNIIVGNFEYPLSVLIEKSNERLKDLLNKHRNAFIQSFLKPSQTFWKQ